MFWKYAPLISQIDSLLEKEDVTLTAILDEDDVLQECRVQNSKLVNFLTTPEHLLVLVKFVTEDPPSDADDATKFKYPNIACELLTCDVPEINNALTKDDIHLDMLYAYLKNEPPLNPLTASFFVKVLGLLTQKKSEKVFNYIKGKDDFLQLLLAHIGTSAIVDYLIKMLRDPEPDDMRNKYVEWISEQGLVRKLLAGMDPSQDSDKHYHTSQCVCEIISLCRETLSQCQENADVSILLDSLESSSTVTELLTFMFEDEYPKESVLVNGLKIILMLFNKKKSESHAGVLEPGNLSNFVNENDLVRLAQAASNAIEAVLPKLSNFVHLLRNPPKQHYNPMPTTNGPLVPPLGATRLCIVSLIDALLSVNAPVANLAIYEYRLLEVILDLFLSYPLNSFLHHSTCAIITTVLTSGTPQEESVNKLQYQLLVECNLIQRLLGAYDNTRGRKLGDQGDENGDANQPESLKAYLNDGHIAHVFKIANTLKDNLASGSHKDYLTELVEKSEEELKDKWNDFVLGPLQSSNENSLVDPLPNDDSLGNMADIPRLGQEERRSALHRQLGFLEEEFDQQQQLEKFEALVANKTSELAFDLGPKDRIVDEEDNLWEELSGLAPRRNLDGMGRDTRLVGFSSDNGDDDAEAGVTGRDDFEEEDSSSDEEDLDSPIVIRQKPRTGGAAQAAPSNEPSSSQEAMDVDDTDEWAVFDRRPRSRSKDGTEAEAEAEAEATTMDTTPAARPCLPPDGTAAAEPRTDWPGDAVRAGDEPVGWADFSNSESEAPAAAVQSENWADFGGASELSGDGTGTGAADSDANWAKFDSFPTAGASGVEMDTSSSSSEEEAATGGERAAGKKRPPRDSDSPSPGERSKSSSSPDRSNGPI